MPKLPKGKPKVWIANSKKKVRYTNKHISENTGFYHSPAWKKTRKAYIQRNPICVWCEEEGVITEGAIVDHIKEIRDGGETLSFDNLQTLCLRHHNQKTAWAKMKRRKNETL
jgi:5-methylcytosine-specific restriction protein A